MTKGLEKKNEMKGSLKGAIEPTAIKIVTRNFEADFVCHWRVRASKAVYLPTPSNYNRFDTRSQLTWSPDRVNASCLLLSYFTLLFTISLCPLFRYSIQT